PEFAPAIIRTFDVVADPDFLLVEKRGSRLLETAAIPLEDFAGRIAVSDLHIRRESDTCREADEIEGIRHSSRLIEIVHAPYPSSVGVAPRPEVLQMDVADAKVPMAHRLTPRRYSQCAAPSDNRLHARTRTGFCASVCPCGRGLSRPPCTG